MANDGKTMTSGSRIGVVVRALAYHQCVSSSIPGLQVTYGLNSIAGSLPSSEGFFSGYSGFPVILKSSIQLDSV